MFGLGYCLSRILSESIFARFLLALLAREDTVLLDGVSVQDSRNRCPCPSPAWRFHLSSWSWAILL